MHAHVSTARIRRGVPWRTQIHIGKRSGVVGQGGTAGVAGGAAGSFSSSDEGNMGADSMAVVGVDAITRGNCCERHTVSALINKQAGARQIR